MKNFKDLREKTLTPAEKKKREEIAKAMERENPGMDMKKKMAIATWQAKRVAEETELDEGLYHVSYGVGLDHQVVAKDASDAHQKAMSHFKKTKPKLNDPKYSDTFNKKTITRIKGDEPRSDKYKTEEVELDEISRDLARRYIRKVADKTNTGELSVKQVMKRRPGVNLAGKKAYPGIAGEPKVRATESAEFKTEAKDGDGANIVRDREFKEPKFKFKSHPYGSPEWHANKAAHEKFKAKQAAQAAKKAMKNEEVEDDWRNSRRKSKINEETMELAGATFQNMEHCPSAVYAFKQNLKDGAKKEDVVKAAKAVDAYLAIEDKAKRSGSTSADIVKMKDLISKAKSVISQLGLKGHMYHDKHLARVKKMMNEQAEDDMPASPDEKSMAMSQAKFIEYVAEEIKEYLEKDKPFPEWMQNKLSSLHENAKNMHAVLAGDYEDEDEMEEAVQSADRKPEKYVRPDGKVAFRMIRQDKKVIKNEDV
jgi:hypothetical protein